MHTRLIHSPNLSTQPPKAGECSDCEANDAMSDTSQETPSINSAVPAEKVSGISQDTRVTVLLVEDHADTRNVISRLLIRLGYGVTAVGSVGEALACEGKFDILLSDIGLPDGTGLDVVRALKERGSVRHTVAMSGYGTPDDFRRSEEAGFARHLVKPLNFDVLRRVLLND